MSAEDIAKSERAVAALAEFLDPAFDAVGNRHMARMTQLAVETPWEAQKIANLAVALSILNELRSEVVLAITNGAAAENELARKSKIEGMSPVKRGILERAGLTL